MLFKVPSSAHRLCIWPCVCTPFCAVDFTSGAYAYIAVEGSAGCWGKLVSLGHVYALFSADGSAYIHVLDYLDELGVPKHVKVRIWRAYMLYLSNFSTYIYLFGLIWARMRSVAHMKEPGWVLTPRVMRAISAQYCSCSVRLHVVLRVFLSNHNVYLYEEMWAPCIGTF